jgi:hypothetical protein
LRISRQLGSKQAGLRSLFRKAAKVRRHHQSPRKREGREPNKAEEKISTTTAEMKARYASPRGQPKNQCIHQDAKSKIERARDQAQFRE